MHFSQFSAGEEADTEKLQKKKLEKKQLQKKKNTGKVEEKKCNSELLTGIPFEGSEENRKRRS